MNIKPLKLMKDEFEPYGSYMLINEIDIDLESQISFYPEKIVGLSEFSNMPALGVLAFSKREFVIDVTERHEHTEEVFGGYSDDTIFHVAEPSGAIPDSSKFKAFILPKGGFVRLKRNVWHHAPFSVSAERVSGIVILPPYTYTHDCFVVKMDEKIHIDI
jgi:ureidoglycolate hydrolase